MATGSRGDCARTSILRKDNLLISKTTRAAAIAAAALSHGAFAQDSAPPASRAAIKTETKAAEKAGTLMPAGEGSPVDPSLSSRSKRTRAERKAETRQARKSGELTPAGETEDSKEEAAELSPKHFTKTRAQGKAEVRRDAKAGKLIPAGEGQAAPTK